MNYAAFEHMETGSLARLEEESEQTYMVRWILLCRETASGTSVWRMRSAWKGWSLACGEKTDANSFCHRRGSASFIWRKAINTGSNSRRSRSASLTTME